MNLKQNLEKLSCRYYQGFGLFPLVLFFWVFSSPLMFLKDSKVQPFLNSAALIPCPHLLLQHLPTGSPS